MKQGWEIKKLGEVCEVLDHLRVPITKKDRHKGIYPYYGASGVQDYVNSYLFDGRYLLVGEDGAKWGANDKSAYIIEGKSWVNNHAHILKINKGINDKLIEYYLVFKDLNDFITGAIVPKLTQQALRNIPIPVPPLSEQERIVEELDLLSGVIEKKRRQLKELDHLAQSIFYDMFGDPVTNERGWEVKKLGEVCEVNPSKKETIKHCSDSDEISFLPMEDLPIMACYNTPIQSRILSDVQSSYTCFAENDVLMAKVTPCFENGKVGIMRGLINGVGFGSSEFMVLRPYEKCFINKEYIYFLVQNSTFVNQACKQLTGTSGLRRVPRQFVENCIVSIPPLPLQKQFAKKVEAIEAQKVLLKQSLEETEMLFNSRMDHCFGEE